MTVVKCPSCGNAINVPEKKTGLWWGIGCLVAALAIPVIVAVIGLLAAIAIPSFVKARDTSQLHACINNMRMLDAAKEQAALQHNYKAGNTVSEVEISQFLKSGFAGLHCPKGGHYTINPVGLPPECSVHGRLSEAIEGRRRLPNPH
jgi:competence protein ComGC